MVIVNVIDYDLESVMCYYPPAYAISQELETNGGDVEITVSSNGIDFSDSTVQLLTYLVPVEITDVHPPMILLDQEVTVTITGDNFYDNSDTGLLYVRLTRQLTNMYDTYNVHTVTECVYLPDSSQVEFTFPSLIFTDKDWVTLELTFDDITWSLVWPDRLAIVKQVELTRTWPSHVYLYEVETEIYLQAGELNSADRGGDFWNMELFDNMQCKFQSTVFNYADKYTLARYFNQTHLGCEIPTYVDEEPILVDVTYDRWVTYSASPVIIQLIEAPIIVSLNNTEYYYTHHEQVYIELVGVNLAKSMHLYVRVGDQVQKIDEIVSSSSSNREQIVFKMSI